MPIITNSVPAFKGHTQVDDKGYMRAQAAFYGTGVLKYYGQELGVPGVDPSKQYSIYVDPEDIFSADAINSFAALPITDGHPQRPVTAKNSRDLSRGHTGQRVGREVIGPGEYVVADIIITDEELVRKVQAGTAELSIGVEQSVILEPGIAPDGTPYDGKFEKTRGDHLAVVPRGRVDGAVIVLNSKGEIEMPDKHETTSASENAAIQAELVLKKQEIQNLQAEHAELTAKLSERDALVASLEAQVEENNAKLVLNSNEFSAAVETRVHILNTAQKIADAGFDSSMSNMEIAKAALTTAGVKFPEDASEGYLMGALDVAAANAAKPKPMITAGDQKPAKPKVVSI